MGLLELREEINLIDEEMVKLFIRRQKTAEAIGLEKAESGIEVFDSKREKKVLERVKALAGSEYEDDIEKLYETLFLLSKNRQKRDQD